MYVRGSALCPAQGKSSTLLEFLLAIQIRTERLPVSGADRMPSLTESAEGVEASASSSCPLSVVGGTEPRFPGGVQVGCRRAGPVGSISPGDSDF